LKKIKVSKTSENVEKILKLPENLPKYQKWIPKCSNWPHNANFENNKKFKTPEHVK
jgi:hypothetical protein